MCGIVGYIGNKEKKEFLLQGLKELEYRGYDSAGIATLSDKKLNAFKSVGKLENLIQKTKDFTSDGFGVSMGHTRWATHGKPTEINAHPHEGEFSYVVHNGIIENYAQIKKNLEKKGVNFLSQTDTEVVVHLFEEYINDGLQAFDAFEKTIKQLQGAYAILLMSKADDKSLFFAKNAVPLLVGQNDKKESFCSSSDTPLFGYANKVIYLEDGDYGRLSQNEILLKNKKHNIKNLDFKALKGDKLSSQKDGFRYFMEKEIYEQSTVLSETLMGRVSEDGVFLDELGVNFFDGTNAIKICACGTSYHAALSASYLFERLAKIRCNVEIASEFRYKKPLLEKDTLFVVISQSGETADTLEALKIAKKNGLKTLAICNVDNSSIVRLADATILTRAGIEKGVASTKAFATQVATLWMVVLHLSNIRKTISQEKLQSELKALLHVPKVVNVSKSLHDKIHRLSKRYLHGHGFFYIGRDIFYPLALEGALKLKEISYLHAEGYASGEMKHGPIALADSELFTIALMPQNMLYEKTKSNVEELSARDTTILAISPKEFDIADDFIKTSDQCHEMCEFFEMMLITQLLALEISI